MQLTISNNSNTELSLTIRVPQANLIRLLHKTIMQINLKLNRLTLLPLNQTL
jgi:hypothetical protein